MSTSITVNFDSVCVNDGVRNKHLHAGLCDQPGEMMPALPREQVELAICGHCFSSASDLFALAEAKSNSIKFKGNVTFNEGKVA